VRYWYVPGSYLADERAIAPPVPPGQTHRVIEPAEPLRRFKSAHSCRMCAKWLEGEWSDADPLDRLELQRQMSAGVCDACERSLRRPVGAPAALDALADELETLPGAWVRLCRSLAEEIATSALVESWTLRYRVGALAGYVSNGIARQWRPYIRSMPVFDFRVMLGLTYFLTCERCGRGRLRPTQAGTPYAHNRPEGGKCS
jgi:hypothetical protein